MQTQVLQPTQENLQLAAAIFRSGGLVGMPTETVYGLGANALDENAALAIFAAKGRPADNPLIVHISALDQLKDIVSEVPECARKLMDAFWPGPLTLIMPKHERIPLAVTAGLSTVAVRFPVHPVAREMIDLAGLPIAAPSANLSGRPSPTTAQHVLDDLNGRIPLIIDGGPCQVGLESTVVDTTRERAVLLRPGGVTREMLQDALGEEVLLGKGVMEPLKDGEKALSPGLLHKHYAHRCASCSARTRRASPTSASRRRRTSAPACSASTRAKTATAICPCSLRATRRRAMPTTCLRRCARRTTRATRTSTQRGCRWTAWGLR